MIWNTIPNEERLRLWRMLRSDISSLPLEDQLKEVAKFCSKMPFASRTIDYYSPSNWPTPWEIIFHGSFCLSSISLFMYYTLILLPGNKDIKLHLVDDNGDIYLLPIINDQYVLNYCPGEVSKYPEACAGMKVLKIYSQDQIKPIN